MGGQGLNCPLCCTRIFRSKELLLQHISNVLENLYCPNCNIKSSSLSHLIQHLSEDECQPIDTEHTIIFEEGTQGDNVDSAIIQSSDITEYQNEISTNANTHFAAEHTYEAQVETNGNSKIYVELYSKQLTKPCLQTRELQLVKENGESRYMLVSQDDTDFNGEGTIVTKQNNDGTISLTTVKDMKIETETLLALENETGDEQYSCNYCNMTFTSVVEHIQTYHANERVVLEKNVVQAGEIQSVPIIYEPMETEDATAVGDKQAPRRVITDTGAIVEEPIIFKCDTVIQDPKPLEAPVKKKSNVRVNSDNVSKDPPPTNKKGKPLYHKVIVKEVQTEAKHAIKVYECQSCAMCVVDPNEFKLKTCKKLKYPCPHCSVAYDNSKSLCAHMKAHKVKSDGACDEPITYECVICCTVFPTNKSLKLHRRMHDPIKARPIEPPVENTDGSTVSEGRFRCNYCDKMIPNDYRVIHMNSHKSSNKMNCGICNKKFNSIEYLEMHMNVHNLERVPVNNQDESLPYNCIYCNRRFARPHEKVKHERIHTGEKPHSCEICGKSFRVSYCLTLHMRTHTGARPYACPHCGKRFKAHSVYNHHLLTHSEVRAYKCPYCPKAFKTSVQLAGHKNSHTKPFSCQQCNRPFASLYAVRVHTETHARQNNLKFSCELCGASYARAFALKDHIKQVHKENEDQSSPQVIAPDEDWILKDNTETEEIQVLNKDLSQEIPDLTNELIVP